MGAFLTYAFNPDGKLVHVDDVANGNECGCLCPSCRKPLQARNAGTIREHHFAHQADVECPYAYETVLHLLAKEKIQEAFYTQPEFNIEFQYRSFCRYKEKCQFVTYDNCMTLNMVRHNLKECYDSCEQEIPFDKKRHRSDLKIWSSTHPERKPVYFEIFSSAKKRQEKLHDGCKVIEIKVEDESDVDTLLLNGFVDDVCLPNLSFSGFKNEDYDNESLNQQISFYRYILYQSGKFRCYRDTCQCRELKKLHSYSLCEICFHTDFVFEINERAKWLGFKKYGIKNCLLCKNYVNSYSFDGQLCRKYKYLGIDRSEPHDMARAKTCSMFELNVEEMNYNLGENLKPVPITEFCSPCK